MKVAAIITEFNPFHNGHKYIISQAKEICHADFCIVITSGSFVQRGEPSFIDKYTKTKVALLNGADLIIELPIPFACASAEYFATCAITLLDSLNIVDYLVFGVEDDNLSLLNKIADILIDEPLEFKNELKENIKNGKSYAAARSIALSKCHICDNPDILNMPNNILALEYLKALKKLKSSIKPVTVLRINAGYHHTSNFEDDNNRLFQASNLRKPDNEKLKSLLEAIDSSYMESFNINYPVRVSNAFSQLAGGYILSAVNSDKNNYFGVPDYLFDKIKNNINSYTTYTEFIKLLKSKNISYTSISRALLHIVLNIDCDLINNMIDDNYGGYIRILGFKKDAMILLNNISHNSDTKLITNVKDYKKVLNGNSIKYFEHNLKSESIYKLCQTIDLKTPQKSEFSQQLIIL